LRFGEEWIFPKNNFKIQTLRGALDFEIIFWEKNYFKIKTEGGWA
jgi:hypothetical protein